VQLSPDPVVSVVIPILNGDRHLEACMSSVLGQSYENIEVVVADQASSDRSLEIVGSFVDRRVRVLPRPTGQLSLHGNWARGLAAATGELVKIVCQDDMLEPDCLAIQVELLKQNPTAVLACGRRRIIDDQGKALIKARGLGNLLQGASTRVVSGGEIAHACTRAGANLLGEPANVLIRQSALPAPLFDPDWHYTIDVEFYMRCLRSDDAVVDNRVLCSFRVSPQQLSALLAKGQARELRRFLAELECRYPTEVSRNDVRLGAARSQLLARARRVLYLEMRVAAAISVRRVPASGQTARAQLAHSSQPPPDSH
jgi:glycosyltransferase involved in cell wall biosynthesis